MSKTPQEVAAQMFNLFYDQVYTRRAPDADDFTDILVDGQVDFEEVAAGLLDYLS
jgi:hypothetical protein